MDEITFGVGGGGLPLGSLLEGRWVPGTYGSFSICAAAEKLEVKAQLQSRVARAEKVAIKYCASRRKEEMEDREKQAAEKRRRH